MADAAANAHIVALAVSPYGCNTYILGGKYDNSCWLRDAMLL